MGMAPFNPERDFRWPPGSKQQSLPARCTNPDCRAPLVLTVGDTLVAIWCGHSGRLVEFHPIYPEHWWDT